MIRRKKMESMISVNEAVDKIRNSKGRFITVSFIKRSDNSLRTMNCRIGVSKGVKGVKRGSKRNVGLITVYDMGNKEFRNINISGLRRVKISGKEYQVG
jgi:C-terminal processing protease CtpA/Prc